MNNVMNNLSHWVARFADSLVKAERCVKMDPPDFAGQAFHLSQARQACEQLEQAGMDVSSRMSAKWEPTDETENAA